MLGLLVFWLASVAGAYYKGGAAVENLMRAEHATQLEKTIAEHNEDAAIDMQAALEAGRKEAKVRTKVVTLIQEVNNAIASKPAPAECRVTDDVLKLMRVAIAIANGEADPPAADSLPNPGPKAPAADRR
jgi:hypothetical protein